MSHSQVCDFCRACEQGSANDALESGIVLPDLMLRDLIKIFHPELQTSREHAFEYYRTVSPGPKTEQSSGLAPSCQGTPCLRWPVSLLGPPVLQQEL